ncbi:MULTISPECIES: LacI family DNA-binding transcriptional regulator [unclassified Microbacterium]|uniref:LacI family DNA-binding transcriptional regulator n=1 Tax=unclassified Microbacterium TaxID=2609290 RepID=UPI0012FBBE25|nr:LacI family DNA-binding transcriptional regulator [Microbacterium sp. MAH-37]MVQ41256.1 LacI family DNA-binding transcriptional regulator [Microbacterium sp. MAH-37]
MARKATTLADVAAAAGVSLSTASKVLNGTGRASEETRARVRETAERLDFRPNALARSFASGQSELVGILIEDASEIFSSMVLRGAERRLAAAGLATLILDAQEDRRLRSQQVRALDARRVDAVLVIGSGPDYPYPSITHEISCPVAYAFCTSDAATDRAFLPDDRGAGRIAAEHLISLGHTRIAHITEGSEYGSAERSRGFLEALADAGLQPATGAPIAGDWSKEWGFRAASDLIDSGAEFDAIFCANDPIAYGAFAALRSRGLRVPEDVALVGHDHFLQEPKWRRSEFLTTIDPDLTGLGSTAAEFLIDPSAASDTGTSTITPMLYVGRTTVAPTDGPPRTNADDLLAVIDHLI